MSKIGPNYESLMTARSAKAREVAMMNREKAAQGQQQSAGRNADGNTASATSDTQEDGSQQYSLRTRGGGKRKTEYQSATAATGAKRAKGYDVIFSCHPRIQVAGA